MTRHVQAWRLSGQWGLRIGDTWFQLWLTDWQPFGEREGLTPTPFTIPLPGPRRITIARSRA